METVKRLVVLRGGGREVMNRWRTEDFQGCESTLIMDACHYTFVQTYGMYNTKYDCGLQVMMMYQCSFISCNKGTTLLEDVDNGRGYHVWQQGMYEKLLYFPLCFAVNLKLLLKKKKPVS